MVEDSAAAAAMTVPAGEIENLLFDLISMESHEHAPEREAPVARRLLKFFLTNGVCAEIVSIPEGRCNIMARLDGSGGGPALLLCGHTDTVPAGGMKDAFVPSITAGDEIRGRGASDMKGALAAMAAVLVALKRSGAPLKGSVIFAGVAGEEEYSPGASHLAASGFRADYAIVGESTGMETGVAHKGVIRCEALFEGRAAHGSVPEKGVNAIYAASRWLEYITKIYIPRLNGRRHPLLGPPTFNAGVINGGTRIAIVPATCSVQFERRMLPGETREGVLAELRETLSAAFSDCPEFSGRIEELPVFRGVPHGPMETRLHEKLDQPMETVSASRLIAALAAAYEKEFGRKTEPKGFPYWTDAAILASIPRLHAVICGPGDIALAHSDEERLPRRELRAAFMIYLRAAMELCAAKR